MHLPLHRPSQTEFAPSSHMPRQMPSHCPWQSPLSSREPRQVPSQVPRQVPSHDPPWLSSQVPSQEPSQSKPGATPTQMTSDSSRQRASPRRSTSASQRPRHRASASGSTRASQRDIDSIRRPAFIAQGATECVMTRRPDTYAPSFSCRARRRSEPLAPGSRSSNAAIPSSSTRRSCSTCFERVTARMTAAKNESTPRMPETAELPSGTPW